jgi:hypothetical protein
MAAHENLAGGLIASAGALFAAWLAYAGVQQQIAREGQARLRNQAEAKLMATLALTQPVHAAALTLSAVSRARAATALMQQEADKLVDFSVVQLRAALNHYTLRELAKDLSVDDRAVFLVILMTLTTFTNLREEPSPVLDRMQRLAADAALLTKIHDHLEKFDSDLALVFARDGLITIGDADGVDFDQKGRSESA